MTIMKKAILLFSLTMGFWTLLNAQLTNKEIEAKGVFGEIAVEKQNQTIKILQGQDPQQKKQTIETVINNPNDYNPPVLYALSRELFSQGDKDEAAFWFYVAQLRARYDANLCMDNSAKQAVSVLNNEYGPDINKYAFQDIDKLEKTVNKVVNFVRTNNENYDHRWINLHGMWVIQAGQGEGPNARELTKPKDEWAAIKKKTIDNYYNGFLESVKSQQK
ncbi:hypothetical protein DTW91_07195 [Chryseobacterium sp. SC28]|nr:hypothetical protein DTW91_07195 [Chryseobacterium sp. SC28]